MKYKLDKSRIQGMGIFCTEHIKENEIIDKAIIFRFGIFPVITEYIGKWVNHKSNCNIRLYYDKGEYYFRACKDIKPKEELTLNYKETPWYILKPMPWYKD